MPASPDTRSDVLVVGGGIMGLFTAYCAADRGARVTVLERGLIGDRATASYGRTRSYRSDYLDAAYVRLARDAMRLWDAFEARTGARALVRCGCMNIAKRSVSPDVASTYAELSHAVLVQEGVPTTSFDRPALRERFPDLDADLGHLEPRAGVVDLDAVRDALTGVLAERGTQVLEGVETRSLHADAAGVRAQTAAGTFTARALVIAAGHGTNGVLSRLEGCRLQLPITRDRPTEAKYVDPPTDARQRFTAAAMPVIAYLDAGIYCHPIVDGVTDAVKIGYYNPPDLPRGRAGIANVAEFIDQCLPGLRGAPLRDVVDTDGCDYDLVADDDFVLGAVPGVPNAFVGVGWRGTGYKFAPWVGQVLAGLALGGASAGGLRRFDPGRFASHDQGSADADAAAATR